LERSAASARCRRSARFFFFSSGSRHTRCLSDWSSDVCSSDLIVHRPVVFLSVTPKRQEEVAIPIQATVKFGARALAADTTPIPRSEERRVGKKCSLRRSRV